ncbi:MaoC/PaaZ C-terminal domain-containing protein [Streptomyces sp. NPDC048603]|uniref:MaoC/PaaZ C-terminal domain-containing protein n=1 Tax=Streptomyces sp. NPDC048603 TaxID=3365577 RepID=UPI003713FCAB
MERPSLTGRHLVTAEDAAAFRALTASAAEASPDGSGPAEGTPPGTVPPAQLAAVALRMCERLLERDGSRGAVAVHGVQRLAVLRPTAVGAPLTSTALIRSVRPLGSSTATEVAVRFTAEDGACVAESTSLLVHGPRMAVPTRPAPPAGARPAVPPPGSSYRVTRDAVRRYAEVSGDRNPIHLSPSAARSAGFEELIAHGMLTFALTAQHVAAAVGEAEIAELQLRFSRPLHVPATGAVLTVRGLPAAGGFALTAADGEGHAVATGRATLRTPPSDRGTRHA